MSSTVIPEIFREAHKTVDVVQHMDQIVVSSLTNLADENQDQAVGSSYLLQSQLSVATLLGLQCRQITFTIQHDHEMDLDITSKLCGVDVMDMDPNLSEHIYEPVRALTSFDPPKRFHRTVWRSLTRRLIQSKLMHN